MRGFVPVAAGVSRLSAAGEGLGMKTIWKFPITMATDFALEIPSGYKVLHVGVQHAAHDYGPFFWAEVDPTLRIDLIHFAIVGTGHDNTTLQ